MKKFLIKIKSEIKILLGLTTRIKREVESPCVWYGSRYGGFYVNPIILNRDSIIYSFGVGEDISFERNIIEKNGCNVFSFDPTPKSINWIKNQELPKNLTFFRLWD